MINSNKIVALNEKEINRIMLDVIDCSTRVKTIFNRINDLVEETKSYYVCSSANMLRSKYEQLNDSYNNIVKNILSYNSDLNLLKKKYALGMDSLSYQIKRSASNMNIPNNYKEGR